MEIIFDAVELQIMDKADESRLPVDVNARYDEQVHKTVLGLKAEGLLHYYGDGSVEITEKGRRALREYHKAEKDISKRRAEETRKERENRKFEIFLAIVSALATAVLTVIIQRLL